ncbi:MAG TPA: iron-containing alcohol dehydrogenase, partial [Armatimonadota bacterium]|nr:iron-containing alcohol dehydrogenase [Armatimonadota bacterium]
MISFTYNSPPKIVFGWGAAAQLPAEAARLGRRPLLVTGRSLRTTGALDRILDGLRAEGVQPSVHEGVPAEPGLDALQAAMDAAEGADSVIAIGGGSVLDVAKGAAALAGTGATARDYFAGKAVPETGRPLIALPTTSGTGSEVTWVCVLVDGESRRKASIRGGGMMPAVALVDPELTVSCPRAVTAYSGMDAFVQAVEAFTSRGANPMTDALALEAAKLTARWLETAVAEPEHREAREGMALGSMMAGIALNTSRLGLVHGIAHPAGAVTGAAHGLLCGLLMPPVMRFNREAAAEKYARLAEELGLVPPRTYPSAATDSLIRFTEGLLARLE